MKFFIKNTNIFLLILIIAFNIAVNFIWLKIDNTPPSWDPANHMLQSMWISDIMKDPSCIFTNNLKCHGCYHLYPPLTGFIASIFYLFLGVDIDNAVLAMNIIFLSLLVIYTYKIGRIILNRRAGLLAAFLVTMYPFIYITSRQYFLDIPLTAMVTMAMYFLIKAEDFKNIKYSFIFGIIFGLGCLTKEAFILFMVGPICFSMRNSKQIKNIIYALTIGAIIASLWYLPSIAVYKGYALSFLADRKHPSCFTVSGLLYYFKNFIINQTSIFYALLFIFSVIFIKKRDNGIKIILQWMICSVIIFTFLVNVKNERYTIPLLPAIALISAFGVMDIKRVFLKRLAISVLIAYSLAQFILQSTGFIKLDTYFNDNSVYGRICKDYLRGWCCGWYPYPKQVKLQIIDDIANMAQVKNNSPSNPVYIISSNYIINEYTLRYLFKKRSRNLYFCSLMWNKNPLKVIKEAKDGSVFIYLDWPQIDKEFSDRISKMLHWLSAKKSIFKVAYTGKMEEAKVRVYIKTLSKKYN